MSKFLKILLTSLVFFSLASIYYADSNYDKEEYTKSIKEILQDLLTQRNEIMNDGIYTCSNIDLVIEKLKAIEKSDVLTSDTASLESIYDNPTDFPKVKCVNVVDISNVEYKDNRIELISDIEWDISYDLEDAKEVYRYFIRMSITDDKYFLEEIKLCE